MVWNPFSKWRVENCDDGRKIRLVKNPTEMFPLYTEDRSARLEAVAAIGTQLEAKIGGGFASQMSGLLIRIGKSNESFQLKMAAAYKFYWEDPCNREKAFERRLDEILHEETFLKRSELELERLRLSAEEPLEETVSAKQERLSKQAKEMIHRLDQSEDELSRQAAFDRAEDVVGEWGK